MPGTRTAAQINERIASVNEKIRQLLDQAPAVQGASSESRLSDQLAALEELLEVLREERSALDRT